MYDQPKAGPTGRFPEGKLREDDEGELQFVVGTQDGQVVIDFGSGVRWLGMPPDSARALAATLIRHAGSIDGKLFVLKL